MLRHLLFILKPSDRVEAGSGELCVHRLPGSGRCNMDALGTAKLPFPLASCSVFPQCRLVRRFQTLYTCPWRQLSPSNAGNRSSHAETTAYIKSRSGRL